jgi:hypothetical protein
LVCLALYDNPLEKEKQLFELFWHSGEAESARLLHSEQGLVGRDGLSGKEAVRTYGNSIILVDVAKSKVRIEVFLHYNDQRQ